MKAAVDGRYGEDLFDGASNIQRILRGMTNDQYETFDGLPVSQIKALNTILESCLSCDRSYKLALVRFGLNGKEPEPREDVSEMIGEDDDTDIRYLEEEIIEKFGSVVGPIISGILA